MAIPKFLEDLNIISKLGDYPGSDDGLSKGQFKQKFDEAGLKIQTFLNDTLIPQLNQLVDVQALLNGILDKTLTAEDKAAPAKTVADELKKKLSAAGGTLTGLLHMSNFRITGVGSPVELTDAATKGYCDAKRLTANVTLTAAGWSVEAPYTQTVAVPGLKATDRPHWGVVLSADRETAIREKEAYAVVDDLDTAENSVVFTCLEEVPTVDLVIQMEVNR